MGVADSLVLSDSGAVADVFFSSSCVTKIIDNQRR